MSDRTAPRTILIDVDGVLIVHADPQGWSRHLERDLAIPVDALQAHFFTRDWAEVIDGRAPLRERLEPVLHRLWPQITYDRLTRYWFDHDSPVDEALLGEIAAVRAGGVEVHLVTNQEHERAHYLWHDLGWRERFDGLHYSADLGAAKPDPAFYALVEQRLGIAPQQLLFIDDRLEMSTRQSSGGGRRRIGRGARPWRR